MSIALMERLSLFSCASDSESILTELMKLKCIELTKAKCTEDALPLCEFTGEINDYQARLQRIQSAISPLEKYSVKKFTLLKPKIAVDRDEFVKNGSADKAWDLVKYVEKVTKAYAEAVNISHTAKETAVSLSPWSDSSLPLDFNGTEKVSFTHGTIPTSVNADKLNSILEGCYTQIYTISESGGIRYVETYILRGYEDKALRSLTPLGFAPIKLQNENSTVKGALSKAEKVAADAEKEISSLTEKLCVAAKDIDLLRILYDIESSKLEVVRRHEMLTRTDRVELLSGWVPEENLDQVKELLDKYPCAYEFTKPDAEEDKEDPPVLLKNNPFAKCFEWIIGMYSYPKYGTYDPTFIMGIFYCILFGMMFADVVYGLLFVLAAFVAVPLLKIKGNLKTTVQMFGYCGISCIVMGILFGGYAGDLPIRLAGLFGIQIDNLALLVDPVKDPLSFLIISLVVGGAHLIAGMIIRFAILCREKKVFDAISEVGLWWVIFIGLGTIVVVPNVGLVITAVGLVAKIILGGIKEKKWFLKPVKGLLGLYDIINYSSDLLSYSRILALGLASSIIAQVINIICTMIPNPIVSIIMFVFIGTFGHLINIGLNALGAFVHTSRLQYIEFFGKFYTDGGRKFEPLRPVEKFTSLE